MPVIINGTTGISGVDGSAGTPAFQGSDANTGIRFGTDIVSLVTGGSDRLYIDSSGRVGVGTSSPGDRLHVVGPAAGISARFSDGVNATVAISHPSSGTSKISDYGGNYGFEFASSSLNFLTAGSERMRIDSSGRVGIGTTSPGRLLQVSNTSADPFVSILGAASNNGGLLFGDNASDAVGQIRYDHSVDAMYFATNSSERVRIDSSGNVAIGTTPSNSSVSSSTFELKTKGHGLISPSNGDISFVQNAYYNGGYLYANTNFAARYQLSDANHLFFTAASGTPGNAISWVERIRINNLGRTFFFDSGGATLSAASSRTASTSDYIFIGTYSATGIDTGTTSIRIFTNGNVQNTNNSYGAISDIKLKENIVDATSQWDDLKALQVRKYNFKEGQTHTQIGLIAQEAELVSPGLVSESPDRDAEGNDLGTVTKSVNYSVLYMKAVKALQEAMERIETLEAKVAALEAA